MGGKSMRRKWCRIKKGSNCFNCINRINVKETKTAITVRCKPDNLPERTIVFNRKTDPEPYCGLYKKGE